MSGQLATRKHTSELCFQIIILLLESLELPFDIIHVLFEQDIKFGSKCDDTINSRTRSFEAARERHPSAVAFDSVQWLRTANGFSQLEDQFLGQQ